MWSVFETEPTSHMSMTCSVVGTCQMKPKLQNLDVLSTGASKSDGAHKKVWKPENVEAKEDTTAEEIFSRWSNDILNPILTNTKSSGSSGAPSQPVQFRGLTRSKKMPAQHSPLTSYNNQKNTPN